MLLLRLFHCALPALFRAFARSFCLDFVAILISYWRIFPALENRGKPCMSCFHDSLEC